MFNHIIQLYQFYIFFIIFKSLLSINILALIFIKIFKYPRLLSLSTYSFITDYYIINSNIKYVMFLFFYNIIHPLTIHIRFIMCKCIIYGSHLKSCSQSCLFYLFTCESMLEMAFLISVKCPLFILYKYSKVVFIIPVILMVNIIPYEG